MNYSDSEHPQGSSAAQLFPGQLHLFALNWQAPHPPCQEQEFQRRKLFMPSECKWNPTDLRKHLLICICIHAYLTFAHYISIRYCTWIKIPPNLVEFNIRWHATDMAVIISETSSTMWLKIQCQMNLGLIQQKITTAFSGYRHIGLEWLYCVNMTHNSEISTCYSK